MPLGAIRRGYIKQGYLPTSLLTNEKQFDKLDKPADNARKFDLSQPQHHLRTVRQNKCMYSPSIMQTGS